MLGLCKSFQIYAFPRGVIPWKETWLCIFQHRKADSEEFLQLSPWQVSEAIPELLQELETWLCWGWCEKASKCHQSVTFPPCWNQGYKRDRAMSSGRCSAAGLEGGSCGGQPGGKRWHNPLLCCFSFCFLTSCQSEHNNQQSWCVSSKQAREISPRQRRFY